MTSSRYHQADVTDPASMAAVVAGREPLAAYLALPPSVFPGAVSALHHAGANRFCRQVGDIEISAFLIAGSARNCLHLATFSSPSTSFTNFPTVPLLCESYPSSIPDNRLAFRLADGRGDGADRQ